MSEKTNVPEIRFDGFINPWEQHKLGDLLQYEQPQKYIVISSAYDDSFDIPVLTAGQSFVLGWTNEKTGIKKASPENPVIIFDDFVTSSHYVDFPFKIKSSAMKLLSSTNSTNDINFSFNLLKQIEYTPISHIRHWISMFAQFNVYAPTANEQAKIGRTFNKFDSLITFHQRKLDILKKIKSVLLEKMFPKDDSNVPEIRFTGFTEVWEQRKFSDVVKTRRGLTYKLADISNNGVRVLRSSNISEDIFVQRDDDVFVKREAVNIEYVNENDILITSANGSSRLVGKHAIVSSIKANQAVHGGFMLLASTKEPYFINASMSSTWYKKFIELFVAGGNGSIGNLNKNDLDNYEIFIPVVDEQKRLGLLFRDIDNLIALHQRKLELLRNIKKSLLNKMFV